MTSDHSRAGKPDFLPVPVLKAKHPPLGAGTVYPQMKGCRPSKLTGGCRVDCPSNTST